MTSCATRSVGSWTHSPCPHSSTATAHGIVPNLKRARPARQHFRHRSVACVRARAVETQTRMVRVLVVSVRDPGSLSATDCRSLENHCPGSSGTEGSNPSPSVQPGESPANKEETSSLAEAAGRRRDPRSGARSLEFRPVRRLLTIARRSRTSDADPRARLTVRPERIRATDGHRHSTVTPLASEVRLVFLAIR